ncbi:MAG: hypothetical protein AAGB34_05940 [Planctomycetota bacterium]
MPAIQATSRRPRRGKKRRILRTFVLISVIATLTALAVIYWDDRVAMDQIEHAVHAWDRLIHPNKKDP